MPDWIERPLDRQFPWPKVLAGLGAVIVAFALVWAIKKHRPAAPGPIPVQAQEPSSIIVSTGTIGEGGSLSQSLGRLGIGALETSQVEKNLKPFFNVRFSKPKDRYEVTRSTSGHFVQMIYWPSAFDYFTVTRSSAGVFAASAGKIPLEETLVGVSGQIQNSLWEAMIAQGTPPEMIYRFAELFGWRVDFLTEPRKGDTYKMIWKRHTGNGAIKDEEIVCAYYNSKEKGEVYGFRLAGEYFDQDGDSLRGEFLRAPLAYRRISSRFTEHRFHPILRIFRPHHGIDYSAARGTPAVSIGDGMVIAKDYNGGLGNELRIRHAGGYISIYGHLMGYPRAIHVGTHVKQGEVVGYVGSTGLSTGPHLHFGLEHDGKLLDFLALKMKGSRLNVPAPERSHYEQIKKDGQLLLAQLSHPQGPLQILDPQKK